MSLVAAGWTISLNFVAERLPAISGVKRVRSLRAIQATGRQSLFNCTDTRAKQF